MIHLVQKLPENIVGFKASSGVTETVMSNFQKLAVSTTLKNIDQ